MAPFRHAADSAVPTTVTAQRASCARKRTSKSSSRAVPADTRSPRCRGTDALLRSISVAAVAAFALAAAPTPRSHTPTPRSHTPAPRSHAPVPRVPLPHLPAVPLHTEFVVEVNAKGQVVRVNTAKGCRDLMFNAQTYGNVLQMWIRHPDGTADVGLYRVTYDYDPHTRRVFRRVAIVRRGGNWGNAEGAANEMLDVARREAEAAARQTLPPLSRIIDATPSPRPR